MSQKINAFIVPNFYPDVLRIVKSHTLTQPEFHKFLHTYIFDKNDFVTLIGLSFTYRKFEMFEEIIRFLVKTEQISVIEQPIPIFERNKFPLETILSSPIYNQALRIDDSWKFLNLVLSTLPTPPEPSRVIEDCKTFLNFRCIEHFIHKYKEASFTGINSVNTAWEIAHLCIRYNRDALAIQIIDYLSLSQRLELFDMRKQALLLNAVTAGSPMLVEAFLRNGAVSTKNPLILSSAFEMNEVSPDGDLGIAELLLLYGDSLDNLNKGYRTDIYQMRMDEYLAQLRHSRQYHLGNCS